MRVHAAAAAVLGCALALASPVSAQSSAKPLSAETATRMARLLEGSKYKYSKVSDALWVLHLEGKHKDEIPVYLSASDKSLWVIAVIAASEEVVNHAEAARTLLRLNGDVAEATFVLDGDDDYVARSGFQMDRLNLTDFKGHVKEVAGAADDAFKSIRAFVAGDSDSKGDRDVASYTRPVSATKALELADGALTVAFDPAKWTETQSRQAGRREFRHARGDGYAMIMTERIQVPTDNLRDVALENMKSAGGTVESMKEERRLVNGAPVLMLQIDLKLKGVPFTYLGYYYGGAKGTVQIVTYTGRSLFAEYRGDFEELLNGLQVRNN